MNATTRASLVLLTLAVLVFAVLAVDDVSHDADEDFLARSIDEEMITDLVRLQSRRMVARVQLRLS